MADTLITCISNEEGFAKEVYGYLYVELEKQSHFEEGKNLQISSQRIRLLPDSNEIEIDESAQVPTGMIKWILKRLLKSDPIRFKDYGVIRFEDSFTIGRLVAATEMGIYSCDLCSYSTLYQEELYTHRILHAGFGP
ncbi:MAG TPA: hypothetical protein VFS46_00730 [Nitrososphaera sp.]|nr:hypothetical protein [Nitrososphaera sp.]